MAKSTQAPAKQPPALENALAPELFVNSRPDFWRLNDTITMSFATHRFLHMEPGTPMVRCMVGRVVMPVLVAQQLAVELFAWLDEIGLRPDGTPAKEELQ